MIEFLNTSPTDVAVECATGLHYFAIETKVFQIDALIVSDSQKFLKMKE